MATLKYNNSSGVSYLVNCACNYPDGSNVTNLNLIEITANDGYIFNELPQVNIYVNNSIGIRINTISFNNYGTLSADGKKITFKEYTQGSQWVISQSVKAVEGGTAEKITLTYNGSLTNCKANFSTGSSEITSETNLIVTADENYAFDTPTQTITFNGSVNKTFSISANKKNLYYNITSQDISDYDTAVINGDFTAKKEGSVGVTVNLTGILTNCTANFTDGEVVTSPKVLSITADEGYEFNGAFYCSDNINGTVKLNPIGKTRLDYDINDVSFTGGLLWVNFGGSYTAVVAPKETLSDFVRIFNPTDEDLSKLSKSTFYNLVSGSDVMISSYITALYKIPFDVTGLMLPDKANIVLGNYDSGVSSTMLDKWILETDGGNIVINAKYNNVFDYINTDCNIYIPYFGKAKIDVEWVIGQTLTITYYTNLYDGFTTVDVVSSFGGNKVFTATKKSGFDVPFVQLGAVSAITDVNIPIYENELNAFVEVIRDIPIENTQTFGKKTVKSVQMSELAGYQVIDDISFVGKVPYSVQTEIRQILRGGVFV